MINDYRFIDYNDYRLSTMKRLWEVAYKHLESARIVAWTENGTKNSSPVNYAY